MPETLLYTPRTMLEVWQTLPLGTLCQLINDKLIMSPAPIIIQQEVLNEINVGISVYLRTNLLAKFSFLLSMFIFLNKTFYNRILFLSKIKTLAELKKMVYMALPISWWKYYHLQLHT